MTGTERTLPADSQSVRSPWIDVDDRLPDWNRLVVAYLCGTKDHSGVRWVRTGFAFMVRHNSREHVVEDQWAVFHYNRALAELDADELTVTHWMPLEIPS